MNLIVQLCLLLVTVKSLTALKKIGEISKQDKAENSILLSKVVQLLVDDKLRSNNRRAMNPSSLAKAVNYFNSLQKNMANKKNLRVGSVNDDQATLVESELKMALSHKKSSLFDRPYVQKQGKNDYLVMRPEIADPFVTIVPNHIYYDAEKKCVNWLDDCSLRGIRAKLLRGVQSPY